LVMNLIALQNGYPIINISGEKMNRMDYYNALEQVQVHGNNKAFRLLVANYSKASLNEWIKLCS
jgi:Fic family protein